MESTCKSASLLLLAAFSGVAALCNAASAQSFTVIPAIPNGTTFSVSSISVDGTRAVGAGVRGDHNAPFIWTAGQGSFDIGLDSVGPNRSQFAQGISADGTTVVGASFGSPLGGTRGHTAFRWRGSGTYQELSPSTGLPDSQANAVSANGSIIAGIYGARFGDFNQEYSRACYWDAQGTVHTLSGLPNVNTSADAISGNGQVIVGRAYGGSVERAFRWSQQDGYQQLPSLTGVPNRNSEQAHGATFDGSIVIGESNFRAVMWQNGAVIPLLSSVPGTSSSIAWSVSSDGSVIGGVVSGSDFTTPAVWTASTGFVPVADYLASNGVEVPSGFTFLSNITLSISADGRTIGGAGYSTLDQAVHGWVATIPSPSGVLLGLACLAMMPRRRR